MSTRYRDVDVTIDIGDDQITAVVSLGWDRDDVWVNTIRTLEGPDGGPWPLDSALAARIEAAALAAPYEDRDVDEAYERAASRARLNGFADTGGKDWT